MLNYYANPKKVAVAVQHILHAFFVERLFEEGDRMSTVILLLFYLSAKSTFFVTVLQDIDQ